MPAFSLGSRFSTHDPRPKSPGPAYDPNYCNTSPRKRDPAYSFGVRPSSGRSPAPAPGPGAYDSSPRRGGPAFSLGARIEKSSTNAGSSTRGPTAVRDPHFGPPPGYSFGGSSRVRSAVRSPCSRPCCAPPCGTADSHPLCACAASPPATVDPGTETRLAPASTPAGARNSTAARHLAHSSQTHARQRQGWCAVSVHARVCIAQTHAIPPAQPAAGVPNRARVLPRWPPHALAPRPGDGVCGRRHHRPTRSSRAAASCIPSHLPLLALQPGPGQYDVAAKRPGTVGPHFGSGGRSKLEGNDAVRNKGPSSVAVPCPAFSSPGLLYPRCVSA